MTHFHIEFDATCPSDWDEAKAREWISRKLTEPERDTLRITGESVDRNALRRIRSIKSVIPFDASDAATECIRIAKEALGEK